MMPLQKQPRNAAMKAFSPKTEAEEAGNPKPQDSPLDYLLSVMRDPAVKPERRDEMAKLALPYLHPKPAVEGGKDTASPDPARLTDTDIARRIAFMLTKAALTPSSQDDSRRSEAQAGASAVGSVGVEIAAVRRV